MHIIPSKWSSWKTGGGCPLQQRLPTRVISISFHASRARFSHVIKTKRRVWEFLLMTEALRRSAWHAWHGEHRHAHCRTGVRTPTQRSWVIYILRLHNILKGDVLQHPKKKSVNHIFSRQVKVTESQRSRSSRGNENLSPKTKREQGLAAGSINAHQKQGEAERLMEVPGVNYEILSPCYVHVAPRRRSPSAIIARSASGPRHHLCSPYCPRARTGTNLFYTSHILSCGSGTKMETIPHPDACKSFRIFTVWFPEFVCYACP